MSWGMVKPFLGMGRHMYSLFFVKIITMTTTVRKYHFAKIIELLRRVGVMTEYR